MPELPEVEVVRAGLAPAVSGARVAAVTVLDDRALTRHPGTAADFEARLTGRTMQAAARRGKFLWLPLHDEEGDPAEALVVLRRRLAAFSSTVMSALARRTPLWGSNP